MVLSILVVMLGTFLTSWLLAKHLASALGTKEIILLAILPGIFQGVSIDAIVNNINAFTLTDLLFKRTPAYILILIGLASLFGIILGANRNKAITVAESDNSSESRVGIKMVKSVRNFALALNIFVLVMIYFYWWILSRISDLCCN